MLSIKNISGILMIVFLASCSKFETGSDFTPGDPPPVPGGFVNSSEVAPDNLVAYFPFNGNIEDTMGTITGGQQTGDVTFVAGRKGMAYQGATNAFISYDPGAITALTSFTVAFWINTEKHVGGAQGVYMLSRVGNFWGNFFVLIEGSDRSNNKMQLKMHFEKPSATNVEHWIDPGDAFWPDDMYGGWRHVVYTYDETTSKVARYISGNETPLPADIVTRYGTGNATSGTLLGPLQFADAPKFIIGAYQNMLGSPYNAPEPWMLNYTGKLDEFRIYNKALTAQEISALYTLERQNR
jgi:hypothetical protein